MLNSSAVILNEPTWNLIVTTFTYCWKDFQEVELKKKQEDEEKAKEMESSTMEEEGSDFELLKVKVRLDALEESVKVIVDETKKLSSGMTKDSEGSKEEQPANLQNTSKASSSAADNHQSKSTVGELTPDARGAKARESNSTDNVSQEHEKKDGN